jgi:hypothetical protein
MRHRTGSAFRDKARALTPRLAAGLVMSCLAAALAVAMLAGGRAPAPAAQDRASSTPVDRPAARAPGESSADFLERIALSHVASLKAPPEAEATAAEPAAPAPRPAARRNDRAHAAKARIAAAGAEAQPSAAQPVDPAAPERSKGAAEAPAEIDWMHPIQSGMRLIAGLDHVVAASKARIAEGVASVTGVLASLGKPPER